MFTNYNMYKNKSMATYIEDKCEELLDWFGEQGFTFRQVQFSINSFSHIYLQRVEFSRQLNDI